MIRLFPVLLLHEFSLGYQRRDNHAQRDDRNHERGKRVDLRDDAKSHRVKTLMGSVVADGPVVNDAITRSSSDRVKTSKHPEITAGITKGA